MKTLNLNIKLDVPVKTEDGKADMKNCDVAVKWIGVMIERAINKPDAKTMRPTQTATMEVQRKYFRLMNKLDENKSGMATLEDDDFKFLERKFNQAEIPLQRDIGQILIKIDDAINKAKVEEKPKG